ncbi:uncharacterized protein HKW66_Vig0151980 [Vigna angularis]|uniref:Ribosomal protein L34Ae n=2 Tax=Phaseolus angularis TaxID=3914 RepID=A0A8T0JTM6_PHAAN|nr:uncharacterized protein LOC108344746 isoform X1 [Vigna angularis]KAG2384039.1 uncharacterized protein HKW66_Vig0151980 [Vigna angularis]BAU01258.1 hypothetical protein VIGAN_11045400 [Vigna angularis var. angularis]
MKNPLIFLRKYIIFKEIFHQRMDLFSWYVWIFLVQLVDTLFWVSTRIFMRYFSHEAINSDCSSSLFHETYHTDPNNSEIKTEVEEDCSEHSKDAEFKSERFEEGNDVIQLKQECSHQSDSNGSEPEAKSNGDCSVTITNYTGNFGVEEKEKTMLVFKFQYQTWNCGETFDFVNTDNDKAPGITSKHEFISGNSFSTFLDETCVHSKYFPLENDSAVESEGSFEPESYVDQVVRPQTALSVEQPNEHQVENLNANVFVEEISAADSVFSEDDFICVSFELDSMTSSVGGGFLLDTDFATIVQLDEENGVLPKENLDYEGEIRSESLYFEHRDTVVGIRNLEEEMTVQQDSDIIENINLKSHCFQDRHGKNLHGSTGSDLEDSYRFDAQWEHQELIEQLKMELNKVRATGLPTTFETQRIMKDLKPWEIDENFKHGSTRNDLTKLYRSYTERMRKFDILNYQKLFAIGALKTTDLTLSFSSRENSSQAITSLLPHLFHHCRRKKFESDPLKKFRREIYSDLEMVYVGQLCLSWEFLRWEYDKALQLWESEQHRFQSYSEVAEEFQQFQVLLLRFLENERFQGPRVEYYARNRCAMQNLLHVPVIREDNTKDEEKYADNKNEMTSNMLVEILEESIRIFWHFTKADKDASSSAHKGSRETQVKIQDPADSEFLREIQVELQKKERRLGEFLKSRSSILRMFQKHEENSRDNFLYLFPQVEIKLVWRVLNMSKITKDQLVWCHNKLNNINIVSRRMHIAPPSFSLFPS